MISSLVSLFFLALAASVSAEVAESRHQQELREHYHHLSYIADYSCHHPQPRSVPVHELLSPYQTRGKAYFPEMTVLHRCDMFSGCCEGAKKCGPVHADILHLPFKVTYLEDMGDKHQGEWDMEYFYFDNHTICGCHDHHGLYKPEIHKVQEEHEHKDHEHKEVHTTDDQHYIDVRHEDRYVPVYEEHHDEHYSVTRPEKRPDQKYDTKKIDSLYITI